MCKVHILIVIVCFFITVPDGAENILSKRHDVFHLAEGRILQRHLIRVSMSDTALVKITRTTIPVFYHQYKSLHLIRRSS